MNRWGTGLYFSVATLIFIGFIYLGITGGFSDTLDIGFVALLWIFVVLAMKTGLVKVPPGTPLPLSNFRVNLRTPNLFRALSLAVLAIGWTGTSAWFVHRRGWDDSWYGVGLVFVPMFVFLGLFMTFLARGFSVYFKRR